jgi:hypothetical protein
MSATTIRLADDQLELLADLVAERLNPHRKFLPRAAPF